MALDVSIAESEKTLKERLGTNVPRVTLYFKYIHTAILGVLKMDFYIGPSSIQV